MANTVPFYLKNIKSHDVYLVVNDVKVGKYRLVNVITGELIDGLEFDTIRLLENKLLGDYKEIKCSIEHE